MSAPAPTTGLWNPSGNYSDTSGNTLLQWLQVNGGALLVQTVQPSPQQVSVTQTFSSNGSAVAAGTVLASFSDITPYTYFTISNTSGFSIQFNISLDGTNFFGVSMFDSVATTGTGTSVLTLVTGKIYTRGVKGVQAQILAESASTNIYAASVIQLAAGVGGF